MKKIYHAFTLLELAIVLIVVSVITAGIMSGTGLIKSSRLNVARSLTERSPVKNIDGLVAWYETTSFDSLDKDEASEDATITNWYDINPESIPSKKNTLIQKTGTVTYVRDGINGVPALNFSSENGTAENLELSAFAQGSTAQNTIFVVFKPKPRTYINSNVRVLIDSHSSNGSTYMGFADNAGADQIRLYATATSAATFSNPSQVFFSDKSYVLSIYYNRAYSKAYLNDTSQMVGGTYVHQSPGSRSLSGLTVGSLQDDSQGARFVGLISEVVIYDRLLKDEERKDVMAYLSKKYDINVSGL